jgi:hypothetical protein
MAVGVIATHGNTGKPFSAQYDHINVYAGSLADQAATTALFADSSTEAHSFDASDTFIYDEEVAFVDLTEVDLDKPLPPGIMKRGVVPPGLEKHRGDAEDDVFDHQHARANGPMTAQACGEIIAAGQQMHGTWRRTASAPSRAANGRRSHAAVLRGTSRRSVGAPFRRPLRHNQRADKLATARRTRGLRDFAAVTSGQNAGRLRPERRRRLCLILSGTESMDYLSRPSPFPA